MNRQVIKNRIRKILAYTFTSIAFLLISAFLILQIPSVQDNLIDRYLGNFSNSIGFTTTVKHFRLLWFDRLELEDVSVMDPASNEMIAARRIVINFRLSQLFDDQDINVDGVFLEKARVLFTKIPESDTSRDLNINIFIARINALYASQSTSTGRSPRINIGEAVLEESQFSYVDQFRDSISTGFNYNQFTFDIDEGQLQNFLILGDTTQFQVNTLLATDRQSHLAIRELSTFFRLSQQSLEFTGLNLRANESIISDSIVFTFNGQRELSDFIEKVNIHGTLKNTLIQPKDLALFAPEVSRMTQPIRLNGIFNGKVNDFTFTNMEVTTGNTVLRGSLDMEGLPDINETFIILNLKNSRLEFGDLGFVINQNFMNRLTPLGRVALDGQFLGYANDFVAKGNFSGILGNITSDINFKVNEKDFERSVYSGALQMQNFDLGRYLNDTLNFQRVTLDGKIKGSGLTLTTADFTLNGKVKSIGIRNYNYSNIETNARFASQLFNGRFKIDDPNLQFNARGSVDLRKGINRIQVQAQIDTALLHNLNLTTKRIFLHTAVDMNTKGLHLDSLTGTADLKDFTIHYNENHLSLPTIHIDAEKKENLRSIQIQSTLIDAEAHGDFLLTDISKDIQKLIREILLNIKNDKQAINDYYSTQTYKPKSYETFFTIHLKNVSPLVDLLAVDLLVSGNTRVEGKFSSGYTSILQAYSTIDSLAYNKALFIDTETEFTASKIADSTSVLAMAFVHSERQVLNKNLKTKNLVAEAIWNKNHIAFGLDADQEEQTNYVRLKGEVEFMKDSTQLRMLPSTINLLNKDWQIDPNNSITVYRKTIDVRDLRVRHDDQFVLFNGALSEDPSEKLSLQVSNLDLSILNPLTGRDISGRLEAIFDLNNYYGDPFVQNDLSIDSLTIDNFLIGDIVGKNQWDTLERKFIIDFHIDRNAARIVNVNGFYNPSRENNPLDIVAKLEKANLKIIEPFFDDIFSNIGGSVTGDYRITGKLESPAIVGEGEVTSGQIMINYLKTLYHFTGTVGMSPNSIYFKNIELTDILNNKGKLNGTITHQNFASTRINIDASFRSFQVLNTTQKDNSLFYGQGYATGDLNIFGPVSNLKFTSNAKTDKNTRIFIPIGGVASTEQKDFIKFVSFTDSTFQRNLSDKISTKLDLTGITLDFNLEVTPDAFCQIILDLKAGDIIYGRGNGEIQLQLDTKGEFNMFGPFEFTEGRYNFTLYDIINKEFEIKKGSRITWFGDPYLGNLDIHASYNQLASFGPIISNQTIATSPQLRRKYPVQVLLGLTGPMLTPEIALDIVTGDLPATITVNGESVRLQFEFQAFKNKLDEQELKRQVFSLIILRRFSPPESFNTSGSDVMNSVSELFSNQLSNFVSQVDENLEVDVDFSRMDEEQFNTFQLRLSYTFLNGRLRITRDGTYYSNQNNGTPANNQNISNIAGDWTVDYLLTPDGKLKVKMYNRTNFNPVFNAATSSSSVTTGVSLTHTQSFNELKDLWRSARNRRKKEAKDTPDANEEATKKEDDGGQ
jgi:predicted nucleic acid-binding protein